jgi:ankyrin repeat protein
MCIETRNLIIFCFVQVSTLLANHARVDVFDLEGRSALHLAAEHGYINVCDALLEHKAFINSKSRIGYTALHMAARNGYTMLVKSLIKEHSAVIDVLTLARDSLFHPLITLSASMKKSLFYFISSLGVDFCKWEKWKMRTIAEGTASFNWPKKNLP